MYQIKSISFLKIMSHSDQLKYQRWKKVAKNAEFEEPTDPFLNHRKRYQNELNRYLQNVNLDFLPPMPKPKRTQELKCSTKSTTLSMNNSESVSNPDQHHQQQQLPYSLQSYPVNYASMPPSQIPGNIYGDTNILTKSSEFY